MSTQTTKTDATKDTKTDQSSPVGETTKRCDVKKVKVGDTYSRRSFGTVVELKAGSIKVKNNKGDEPWDVGHNIIENEFSFANQHEASAEVTGTDAIKILMAHPYAAMTVCYHKKPDPKATADALKAGQGTETDRAWASKVKKLMEGEEREMIGYHQGSLTPQGHLQFHETGVGLRSVDPRTLNFLVVDRSKYVVK